MLPLTARHPAAAASTGSPPVATSKVVAPNSARSFKDDPLGAIQSTFGGKEEQIIEEDYGRRAPGLVVDAHTRFIDFTSNAENVMPIFNSGEFGVAAAIRDYMQQSYSNFQFPGAIPAR